MGTGRSETVGASLWLAATVALACGLGGCAVEDESGDAEIAVALDALTSADVDRVTVTITGAGIADPIVRNLARSGGQWTATIGGIPSGSGRTFTAVAYDDALAMPEVYRGVTSGVTIPRAGTTTVLIVLQQSVAPTPFRNDLPIIDSVVVSPSDALPGEDVNLTFTAHDPNPSDNLTWVWVGPSGASSFESASGSGSNVLNFTSVWHAPIAEGTYRLTLRVTDTRGARRTTSVDARVGGRGAATVRTSFNNWPVITTFSTAASQVAPGATTTYTASATDADSDPTTATLTDDCGGAALPGWSGTWTAPATARTCVLTLTVTDSRGGVTTGSIDVLVGTVPTPSTGPVFTSAYQSTTAPGVGEDVTLEVTATDPDGDPLTFTWEFLGAPGSTLGAPTSTATTSSVVLHFDHNTGIARVTADDGHGHTAAHELQLGGHTCWEILHASATVPGNDYYTIDPDGPGGVAAFTIYCAMAEGGWTAIGRQLWMASEATAPPPGVATPIPYDSRLVPAQMDPIIAASSHVFVMGVLPPGRGLYIYDPAPAFGGQSWRSIPPATGASDVRCSTTTTAIESMAPAGTHLVDCDPLSVGEHQCGTPNGWLLLHSDNQTLNASGQHPCPLSGGPVHDLWVR